MQNKWCIFFIIFLLPCYLEAAKTPSYQMVLAELEDATVRLSHHETELSLLSERLDDYDTKLQAIYSIKPEILLNKVRALENEQKVLSKTLAVLTTSLKDTQKTVQSKLQGLQDEHKALLQDLRLIRKSLVSMIDSSTPGNYPDIITTAPKNLYIVRSGDTLSKIAKKHGLSTDSLKKYNKLSNDSIYAGQKLFLPTENK